jgi:LysR family glycine cleavage system transcriptional activator
VLKTHFEMRRKIPSTSALTAFEAAARHESFTLAGEELALTQSAVGRQIANLEELVGIKLFRRTRRGVALTPAGTVYAQTIRRRLDEFERDTVELAARSSGGGLIELGVVPTFATHWLVPRLGRFAALHPGVQVNLHVRTRPFLFEEAGMDAAIHAGEAGWPGTSSQLLMPEQMVTVCAPALLGSRKTLKPAQIAQLPLVQMTTRPLAWRQWFRSRGVEAEGDLLGTKVELFSMAVQAAIHGLGVALVPEYLVRDAFVRNVLAQACSGTFASGLSYYFIQPLTSTSLAPVEAFHDWITREAVRE